MPQEEFEVGDQVYLPASRHLGTIVAVRLQTPFNSLKQSDAPNIRAYNIKLDDGATLMSICRGIERVVA